MFFPLYNKKYINVMLLTFAYQFQVLQFMWACNGDNGNTFCTLPQVLHDNQGLEHQAKKKYTV